MGFTDSGWMMVIWMIVFVFLIVTAVKRLLGLHRNPAATDDALSILAERSAKGEITKGNLPFMHCSL